MLQLKTLVRVINQSDSDANHPFGVSFENLNISVPDGTELTAAALSPFVVKAFHNEYGFNRNIFVDVVTSTDNAIEVTGITVEGETVALKDGSYEEQQTHQIVWEVLPEGVDQTVTFTIELDEDNPATGLTVSPAGLIDSSNVTGTSYATITITSTVDSNISTILNVFVEGAI